jgi:hypothetical protein
MHKYYWIRLLIISISHLEFPFRFITQRAEKRKLWVDREREILELGVMSDYHPLSLPFSFIDGECESGDQCTVVQSPLPGYNLDQMADDVRIWKRKFDGFAQNNDVVAQHGSVLLYGNKRKFEQDDIYDI